MPLKRKNSFWFKVVDKVIECIDKDNTVKQTLIKLKNENLVDILPTAAIEKFKDIPEYEVCKENNIKMAFGVGGSKFSPVQS